MSAERVRLRVPKNIWNGYFKFCVERNPFDKSLSHFHMHKAQGRTPDFDSYLEGERLCRNLHSYTDSKGALLVDRVLRFEDLDHEIGTIMGQLGLPYEGRLSVRAKAHYRKDRSDYREVITPAQRARIEQVYADALALHGYSF
jgi:hypothetical protein